MNSKNEETDVFWWLDDLDRIGIWEFSFDQETLFSLFHDYPYKLTKEQKEIFDRENPFGRSFCWANDIMFEFDIYDVALPREKASGNLAGPVVC